MRAADVVGIDEQLDESFQSALKDVLRALNHQVERFSDPARWLSMHTGNLGVVAISSRSPQDIRTTRAKLPASVIVAASNVTPGPGTFRQYLKAGVNGIVAADQPSLELSRTLAAILTGLVVIPTGVARALVDRLEEPPPRLRLTERDSDLLRLITEGATPEQIAAATGYTDRHLRRITAKLLVAMGATNRAHAASLATRWGLS